MHLPGGIAFENADADNIIHTLSLFIHTPYSSYKYSNIQIQPCEVEESPALNHATRLVILL